MQIYDKESNFSIVLIVTEICEEKKRNNVWSVSQHSFPYRNEYKHIFGPVNFFILPSFKKLLNNAFLGCNYYNSTRWRGGGV